MISEITKKLDRELEAFAKRRLKEAYRYVIVDARYERIRDHGTIQSPAVLIAIGVNDEGRRCILGVELAERESRNSRTQILRGLRERGLHSVEIRRQRRSCGAEGGDP